MAFELRISFGGKKPETPQETLKRLQKERNNLISDRACRGQIQIINLQTQVEKEAVDRMALEPLELNITNPDSGTIVYVESNRFQQNNAQGGNNRRNKGNKRWQEIRINWARSGDIGTYARMDILKGGCVFEEVWTALDIEHSRAAIYRIEEGKGKGLLRTGNDYQIRLITSNGLMATSQYFSIDQRLAP